MPDTTLNSTQKANMPPAEDMRVIISGTDHSSGRGGLHQAVSDFVTLLERLGCLADVLCTHRRNQILGPIVPWLTSLARVRSVVRLASKGSASQIIVYAHAGPWYSLLRESSVLWMSRHTGANTVLHLHSAAIGRYAKSRIGRTYLRVVLLSADRCLVLTPSWKVLLEKYQLHPNIRVVPDFLRQDSPLISTPVTDRPSMQSRIRIVCCCRLVQREGLRLLIRAMQRLPAHFQLTIAGDGPLKGELEQLCAADSLSKRVDFVGWIDDAQKIRLFDTSDILALASEEEGFGLTFIEAMARRLPVVAFDAPSIRSVVDDEVCGLLFDERTPIAIAGVLRRLECSEYRAHLGKNGRAKVLREYSEESTGRRLLAELHTTQYR